MKLNLIENITNSLSNSAEDLAKKIHVWYDWDYKYIDDGSQYKSAVKKNESVIEWFNKHPSDMKKKAYNILKSKLHSSSHGELKQSLSKHLNETRKKSINESGGNLKVEKRKDGKYYWEFTFKSGKKHNSFDGFDTPAAAQKDFMYSSRFLKELSNINEVVVTRVPNISMESDAYIIMLELLKNNAKFKSIVSTQAEDLYSGGRTTNIFKVLQGQLSKIITPQIINSVVEKLNQKRKMIFVDPTDVDKGVHTSRFAGILALGIVDSLIGDPLDLKLIKDLGNAKVAQLAKDYMVNRGKSKLGVMMGNKGF